MRRYLSIFFLYTFLTPLIGFIAAFIYSLYTGVFFDAFSILGIAYAVGLIPSVIAGFLSAFSFAKTGRISRIFLIIVFAFTVIFYGWLFRSFNKPDLLVLVPISALWGLIVSSMVAMRFISNERITVVLPLEKRGRVAKTTLGVVIIVGIVSTSLMGWVNFAYQSAIFSVPLKQFTPAFLTVHLPFIVGIFILAAVILAAYIYKQSIFETRFFDNTALIVAGFYVFYYLLQAKTVVNVNFLDLLLMPAISILAIQLSYRLIVKALKLA